MKIKFIPLTVMIIISLFACDNDDEAPKTPPTVTTVAPTNVTTSSVTVGGTITDNGNDVITKSGIVYSSTVSLPTIEDNKVESTVTEGAFSMKIENLSSGTNYHVRAFATNSVTTSYGNVVDFATGNLAPVVSEVAIIGKVEINKTITAYYKYNDSEGDLEGGTLFQWYVATSSAGANEAPIDGATGKTLLIPDAQDGMFIRVSITPKAATGTTLGVEVKSGYTTAVGAETVTFTYGGSEVTYGTIVSEKTQKKWLDRNLGAGQIAQSATDYIAYGDLFQWGRLADGHQRVTRIDGTDTGVSGINPISTSLSGGDVPLTNGFITTNEPSQDWRNPGNDNLWQGADGGINNPCPKGWRVATQDEWAAEEIADINDGYSKLRLTYTGFRNAPDGAFMYTDAYAVYWTSSFETPEAGSLPMRTLLNGSIFMISAGNRATGSACRCIKE